ncbi:MAG: methyltransferase domain-containing protein [Spirochaetes bacterium]|nr:methyltransferase domain-containing protein [Spirochaetota bacterium]
MPKYIGPDTVNRKKKMSREEIRERFNSETADLYSQKKPLWFPEFEYVFSLVLRTLKDHIPGKARILDLGAGTGNLARTVLEHYPDAFLTLVDFSDNMLKAAPRVLSGFKGKYEIKIADFFELEMPAKSLNCVVSSFAIHHGRGEKVYRKLYKNIYRWLGPGGIFACCDVVDGDSKHYAVINEEGWKEFLRKDFSEEDITRILSNYYVEDSPLSLRKHMELLKACGFSSVDVLWKKYNFGLYSAIKKNH